MGFGNSITGVSLLFFVAGAFFLSLAAQEKSRVLIIIKNEMACKRFRRLAESSLLNNVEKDEVSDTTMLNNALKAWIIKNFTMDIEYICTKYGVKL